MKVRVLKIEVNQGVETSREMTFDQANWEVIRKTKMGCRWELLPEKAPAKAPEPTDLGNRPFKVIDVEKNINFVTDEDNGWETDIRSIRSKVERPEKKTRAKPKPVPARKPRTKKG